MLIRLTDNTYINPDFIACLQTFYPDGRFEREDERLVRITTNSGAELVFRDQSGLIFRRLIEAANKNQN